MQTFLTFLLRLVFLAAGLVFAASLAVVFAIVLAVWALRAGWARLTGKPVSPFIIRIDPRGSFDRVYRRAPSGSATPRADSIQPGGKFGDVTDVEPRVPGR